MSVIDDFAKAYLHRDLRDVREAVVWKLDELGEYDVRRPLTATGTDLLGLVKHHATIAELDIDSPGHADILREQLDGATGTAVWEADQHRDATFREVRRAEIDRAAGAADPSLA